MVDEKTAPETQGAGEHHAALAGTVGDPPSPAEVAFRAALAELVAIPLDTELEDEEVMAKKNDVSKQILNSIQRDSDGRRMIQRSSPRIVIPCGMSFLTLPRTNPFFCCKMLTGRGIISC